MKKFRLQTSLAASNYVLFSADAKLARYASEVAILEEFFTQRENLYKLRKQYLLARLRKDYEILVNKVKFTPDGDKIVSVGAEGAIFIWRNVANEQ